MGRLVGWTLGVAVALAVGAAPAAAQSWSVGVHIGNGPVYAPGPRTTERADDYYPPPVYHPPVYAAPVYAPPYYRAPIYGSRVYYPAYRPYHYGPAYRGRVVAGGRPNGYYRSGDVRPGPRQPLAGAGN